MIVYPSEEPTGAGAIQAGSGMLNESVGNDETFPLRPVFASIGTVLVDCFDTPPRPSLDTQTPISSRSPSPAPNPSTLSSTLSSLSVLTTGPTPRVSTPQREFASNDPSPESSERGSNFSTSTSTSLSQLEPIEVLGGGALYALIGARIWLRPALCRTLVDTSEGREDLASDLEEELESYGKGCWGYLEGGGRRMIRARIRYEGTARLYKHLVPPITRRYSDLLRTPIDGSEYLHIAPPYSPEDVCKLLAEQRDICSTADGLGLDGNTRSEWRPKIVYEPAPLGCHTGQKAFLEELLPHLEVLSPNHEELLSLYGQPLHSLSSPDLRPALEDLINHILDLGIGTDGTGIVAVRCGRLGSVIGTRKDGIKWIPAYWSAAEEGRVKDVTGGGNAYIGGFIAGLSATDGDAYEAALSGTISASFVVEQIGLPKLTLNFPRLSKTVATVMITDPVTGEHRRGGGKRRVVRSWYADERPDGVENERWNGDVPEMRLEVLRERIEGGGDDQMEE